MKLNTKDETKYKYGEDIQDKNSFDTGWKILNKNCEHKKINKWINKKIKKHKQVNQPIKKRKTIEIRQKRKILQIQTLDKKKREEEAT